MSGRKTEWRSACDWTNFPTQNKKQRHKYENRKHKSKRERQEKKLCIFLIRLEHFILMSLSSCVVCEFLKRLKRPVPNHNEMWSLFSCFFPFYFIKLHTILFQSNNVPFCFLQSSLPISFPSSIQKEKKRNNDSNVKRRKKH